MQIVVIQKASIYLTILVDMLMRIAEDSSYQSDSDNSVEFWEGRLQTTKKVSVGFIDFIAGWSSLSILTQFLSRL